MANRLLGGMLGVCLAIAACASRTPDQLLADARAALAAGELRTAEIHLKNLLQQQPNDSRARAVLGEVLLQTGQPAAAEQSLRKALDLGADAGSITLPLAGALVAESKFDEALEFIRTAAPLPRTADRVALLDLQGAAYRGLGQRDRAEEAYRQALAIDPASMVVRTDLAATLLELRRAEEAGTVIAAVLQDDPTFAPALLVRANLEVRAGRRTEAEQTLGRIVDAEQGKPAHTASYAIALGRLSEVQLALGKLDEAAANADALLKLNPKNPAARYLKAAVAFQRNDLDTAKIGLESLVAEFPDYAAAYRVLGEINLRQDQTGQAMMYFSNAINHDQADNAARIQLAKIYIRNGNISGARELLATSVVDEDLFAAFVARTSQQAGLEQQAKEYFDRSERQPPKTIQGLIGLASAYAAAGEYERAIRVLQAQSFDDQKSEQTTNYLLALVQLRQGDLKGADETAAQLQQQLPTAAWPLDMRGTIAMFGGNFPAARAFHARALELEPNDVAALLNLARVAVLQKDGAEAERNLQRVLAIDPAHPVALFGLAQFAAERGDLKQAHALVARAPESAASLRANAELLVREGKFDDAAAAYAQVFALQPSEDVALRAFDAATRAHRPSPETQVVRWSEAHPRDVASNFTLGSLALGRNELDEAARRFEAVLAANPNHAPTLNNLAWVYGERRDPRAIALAERARAVDPKNPSIADTLGWLYVQNGESAKGLALLEQASAALRDQGEITYHMAVALAETGDTARAIQLLEPLLADGRNFPGRSDAEKRLAALRNVRL